MSRVPGAARPPGPGEHVDALGGDGCAALRAVHLGSEVRTAVSVSEAYGRTLSGRDPAVAPGGECHEDWYQVTARVGERVLVSRRVVAVAATLDDPAVDERIAPEPLRSSPETKGDLRPVVTERRVSGRATPAKTCPRTASHLQGDALPAGFVGS